MQSYSYTLAAQCSAAMDIAVAYILKYTGAGYSFSFAIFGDTYIVKSSRTSSDTLQSNLATEVHLHLNKLNMSNNIQN